MPDVIPDRRKIEKNPAKVNSLLNKKTIRKFAPPALPASSLPPPELIGRSKPTRRLLHQNVRPPPTLEINVTAPPLSNSWRRRFTRSSGRANLLCCHASFLCLGRTLLTIFASHLRPFSYGCESSWARTLKPTSSSRAFGARSVTNQSRFCRGVVSCAQERWICLVKVEPESFKLARTSMRRLLVLGLALKRCSMCAR